MGPPTHLVPPLFEDLIARHEREIMRYLLRLSGSAEDAADLFQETWLRAYRAYPRIDASRDVRPWLYAIATNLARNHVRNRIRRARVIGTAEAEPPASGGANRESDGYAAMRARELIDRLPKKQREVLVLRCFGGLEIAQVADALGCSKESARMNLSLAMKKIREQW